MERGQVDSSELNKPRRDIRMTVPQFLFVSRRNNPMMPEAGIRGGCRFRRKALSPHELNAVRHVRRDILARTSTPTGGRTPSGRARGGVFGFGGPYLLSHQSVVGIPAGK
jgi:hypothetical protein